MEKLDHFIVTRYQWQLVNGESKIVISQVGAYDKSGKWIKWAGLKKVQPYLSKFPITFKNLDKKDD